MSKEKNNITYQGDNDELFVRFKTTGLDPKTKLIVPETHNAILLKDGQMMDTLNSGIHDIFDPKHSKTQSVLVEVIFMSKTAKLRVNWGTKTQFSFRDTETNVPVKVGAHGEFEVQISNPRKAYLELIGAENRYDVDQLKERLAVRMMSKVEPAIARAMHEKNITFDRLCEYKDEIAQSVLPELSKMFEEDYGLKMFSFTIANIIIPDECIAAVAAESQRLKEKAEAEAKENKSWEKEKYMREADQKAYEKYLEACKSVGAQPTVAGKAAQPNMGNAGIGNNGKVGGHFCSKCGHAYQEGSKFCPNCGAPVGNGAKICPSCHKENDASANFCNSCGTKL